MKATPFLRWAGSKRSLLKQISPAIPQNINKYIEPFAGSASLFFKISPQKAVLGDLNRELVETYWAIVEDHVEVWQKLSQLPLGKDAYYEIRAKDQSQLSETERAARFIYLNRFCFNGLYRTNKSGQFNVPYGSPRSLNIPSEQQLGSCADALRNAKILHCDFENLVSQNVENGDLVYLDPPFYTQKTRTFREYNASPFSGDDLQRLKSLLKLIEEKSASFILSYAYCEEALEAFSEYKHTTTLTRRNISGFPQHRKIAKELIVSNTYT